MKRWNELDPRVRRAVLVTGGFELGLRIAALIDLAQRPASGVRGTKRRWALALVGVNSLGLLPLIYFLRGRTSA